MRALIVILAFTGASYAYVDMRSESTFESVVLPLFVVLGFIALALWFVGWLYRRGVDQRAGRESGGAYWDGDAGDGGG